ncbi:helix-turn-helix transcriptional regulator [Curtobacterium sp. MCBA15_001]|uniref:helix-turn-helix transcriptional regulator n=1 Tax=Curtobacterium sp. MCBA15_001 TaxID=1898731 RepID=UPI001587CF76|nr:helix-turn-helix transcriptional regulator [Curtobacterium sp. MCBA15_001]
MEQQPDRFDVSGSSLGEARAVFESGYDGSEFRVEPLSMPTEYRYSSIGDDGVSLRSTVLRADGRGTISTGGDVVVSWLTSGSGMFRAAGADVSAVQGRPNLYPVGERFGFHYVDSSISLVQVDAGFLARLAGVEGAVGGLGFNADAVPDVDDVRRWNLALRSAAPALLDASAPDLARTEGRMLIAAAVLRLFPPTVGMPAALLLPKNVRVRAAVEYIHANADLPITVIDVAEAVGASVRALQSAFQRHLESTPNTYLRNVRLDRVRALLLRADPAVASVAGIASAWGFLHLGRFAATYTQRVGEKPSATLRHTW